MKKLLCIPLALLALSGTCQVKKQQKVIEVVDSASNKTKYKDNIDDRMKGPNGEKVYIGVNGGRYYRKGTQKVYMPLSKKKKVN